MDREAWHAATHGAAGSEAAEPSCLSGEARPAPCGPLPPPSAPLPSASARVAPVGIPQLRGVGGGLHPGVSSLSSLPGACRTTALPLKPFLGVWDTTLCFRVSSERVLSGFPLLGQGLGPLGKAIKNLLLSSLFY